MNRRSMMAGAALAGPVLATRAVAKSATPAELITRFAATLSAHDMMGFSELFAEDYVNHQTSAAAPPPPPGRSDKQLSVGFFAARLAGMPDLKVGIEASVVSADQASASFVYSGTHGGVYYGVAPTGKALRFTSCDIFAVRGGKFVEHWGMGDLAGVLAQLKG